MRKEAKLLLNKSLDSLIVSVEHFNKPADQGRVETVLILLDHSFEMLLKAAILHRGGRIREPGAKQTIGFATCVRKGFSEGQIKFLTEEQTLLLQAINGLRDAAQHHLLDISEQHLYMHAQAGLTLYRDLLGSVFGKDLSGRIPARVLPLCTLPPTDIGTLFGHEVEQVRRLLEPGHRRRTEALAKLRALAIVDGAIRGEQVQPGERDLQRLGRAIQQGTEWRDIFPSVASIELSATGYGPSIDLRITKKEGIPVHLVPEGTPGAAVIGVKRVAELDYYNLGSADLARHVGLTVPKTGAVIKYLELESDPDCFREVLLGRSRYKRYSQKAIDDIRQALPNLDLDDVWTRHGGKSRTERVG